MREPTVKIAGRSIGNSQSCFVIAEAGVNHNGNIRVAKQLVDAAKKAGADAVKFQTFKADRLVAVNAPKAKYQQRNTPSESQLTMLRKLELSEKAHRKLKAYCRRKNILFLSSPFDEQSSNFLDELNVPAFKVPSGEIINLPFLTHVARKKKPMVVSTGMSDLKEVKEAVHTIRKTGNRQIVLLHCVSNYPAAPENVNLRAMETLRKNFRLPVGFSDHTLGIEISLAAVALGACIIEKHLTLDRNSHGPDHRASLEPEEFKALVEGIRRVEASLGDGRKEPCPSEKKIAAVARKSLVAVRDIPAGTVLNKKLIAAKRPGTGLPPAMLSKLTGRRARVVIRSGTLIRTEMVM